jgi:hypothetical protein
MELLHQAQAEGTFVNEEGRRSAEEDPELALAVEEARKLLEPVKGIRRVAPGRNEEGDRVVLVVAERGFGEAGLNQVPRKVRRFATVLALAYELLPLRRER